MKTIMLCAVVCISSYYVAAQQPASPIERRVPLTEAAVALDGAGSPALEATLRTTSLNGADDSPVTNIRLVVKNSSSIPYAFVSGLVTFYDSSAVRCGEGLFKADALAVNEAFETDTPGIRIRCAPTTWRIVATNLLPLAPNVPALSTLESSATAASRSGSNLIISVDGEEHPIQIDKPMVLTLGNIQRTIVVRAVP
jgi:hypothetical protein